MPTPQQVADFLGRGDNARVVALAGDHLPIVQTFEPVYTEINVA